MYRNQICTAFRAATLFRQFVLARKLPKDFGVVAVYSIAIELDQGERYSVGFIRTVVLSPIGTGGTDYNCAEIRSEGDACRRKRNRILQVLLDALRATIFVDGNLDR